MKLEKIVEPLLEWYQLNKRDLPWRKDQEPYHIWISEIMLQQTRVEAVKEYYIRFMQQLPTIDDLAKVKEEKLLKLWEGLGYYNRARNLKKAAQTILTKYHGQFPSDYNEILELSGIGAYTAGAIASICFKQKVVAVDGNVLRVLSRLMNSYEMIDLPETKNKLSQQLRKILPEEIDDFNQALMELGALVCLPKGTIECKKCPLNKVCGAYKNGTQMELPKRLSKKKKKKENKTIFLFICDERIAILKRPNKGLLATLYEFPNINKKMSLQEVKDYLKERKIDVITLLNIGDAKHIFTHIEWHMIGYQVLVSKIFGEYEWVSYSDLKNQYAIPSAFQFFKKNLYRGVNNEK